MHVTYKNQVRHLVWALPQMFVISFWWEYWQSLLFWNVQILSTTVIVLCCRMVEVILSSDCIPTCIYQWDSPHFPFSTCPEARRSLPYYSPLEDIFLCLLCLSIRFSCTRITDQTTTLWSSGFELYFLYAPARGHGNVFVQNQSRGSDLWLPLTHPYPLFISL